MERLRRQVGDKLSRIELRVSNLDDPAIAAELRQKAKRDALPTDAEILIYETAEAGELPSFVVGGTDLLPKLEAQIVELVGVKRPPSPPPAGLADSPRKAEPGVVPAPVAERSEAPDEALSVAAAPAPSAEPVMGTGGGRVGDSAPSWYYFTTTALLAVISMLLVWIGVQLRALRPRGS